jgi:hypothetical protein
MINKQIAKAITEGLLAGYGGETKFETTNRGGLNLKRSHYEKDGVVYHDEWLADKKGGGQELVSVGGLQYTRQYAGGIANPEVLASLGITKEDIIGHLVGFIQQLADKARLDIDCEIELETGWKYSYKVKKVDKTVEGLISSKEKISYQGTPVFIHRFLLCPFE